MTDAPPRHLVSRPSLLRRVAAWFTTAKRQAIQVFAGSLAPLFIILGIGTEDQWTQALIIFGASIQFLSSVLSLVNLRGRSIWTVLRGALYTLGATLSPALVSLHILSPALANKGVLALSLLLASVGSLVAVLTAQKQLESTQH